MDQSVDNRLVAAGALFIPLPVLKATPKTTSICLFSFFREVIR
jgi:hypothetical protein